MSACTCETYGACIPCEPQRRAALARLSSTVTNGAPKRRGSQAVEGELSPVGNGRSAKGSAAALTPWTPARESLDELEVDCA